MKKVFSVLFGLFLAVIRIVITALIGLFFAMFRVTLFNVGKRGYVNPGKAWFIRNVSYLKMFLYENAPWVIDFLGIGKEVKSFYYRIYGM